MSYTPHDFQSGQHLYAAQLNEMDTQIAANDTGVSELADTLILTETSKDNITTIAGFRKDTGAITTSTAVTSYELTREELGVDSVNLYLTATVTSEVRVFDGSMSLKQKFNLTTEPRTVELKYGWIVSVPIANSHKIFLVIERKKVKLDELMKASAPSSGYENFGVSVNYHDFTGDDGVSEYTDYGVIALPKTYQRTGKPTRLVIFCQGTGERIGETTNPLTYFGWNYFLAKGYAVLDMNGMATGWGEAMGFPVTNQHYCNRYLLSSYAKGYEYVVKKYNLDPRVYVAGISMGGGASALIVQSKILPVIAHVMFCPVLSIFKQDYMKPWNGSFDQRKTIAGQNGFDNWQTTTNFDAAYFKANYDKVVGFDNLLINTIGDHDTANDNYGNDAETNAYHAMSKSYPVPVKIWHCMDDATVLERYSEYMVRMIRNAGGQAWLRTFETGGHAGGWNNSTVTDAGVSTSINFYEAVKFLERFA